MPDVLIAGGGVIGLSIAWELASHGVSVSLIDQGRIGREASWAGAGMLPPGSLAGATGGEPRLRAFSHSLWPQWSDELRQLTGIDNGYRVCGGINLSFDRDLTSEREAWSREGNTVQALSHQQLAELEAAVSPEVTDAFLMPEFGQVRNPRQLKALISACHDNGVELIEGTPLLGWERAGAGAGAGAGEGGRIVAARTGAGRIVADQFVTACGAWSGQVLSDIGCDVCIEPLRGQIALLKTVRPLFRHVLQVGPRYLVPRSDGRTLIGSTEERVGFVKRNTVSGVQSLLEFAAKVVPNLRDAELERCWSGLRPAGRGDVPYIGPVPGTDNLFVATGHFRSGLQMSPGTAVLMRQMLLGQETTISVAPYAIAFSKGTNRTGVDVAESVPV
jgi:glycine oxidase